MELTKLNPAEKTEGHKTRELAAERWNRRASAPSAALCGEGYPGIAHDLETMRAALENMLVQYEGVHDCVGNHGKHYQSQSAADAEAAARAALKNAAPQPKQPSSIETSAPAGNGAESDQADVAAGAAAGIPSHVARSGLPALLTADEVETWRRFLKGIDATMSGQVDALCDMALRYVSVQSSAPSAVERTHSEIIGECVCPDTTGGTFGTPGPLCVRPSAPPPGCRMQAERSARSTVAAPLPEQGEAGLHSIEQPDETIRAAYEAWAGRKNLNLKRKGDGYQGPYTEWCWHAFYAATRLQESVVSAIKQREPTEKEWREWIERGDNHKAPDSGAPKK